MKFKVILCLALVAFHLPAPARGVRLWSDAELMQASDLVVAGQPIKVEDLDETNSLGWSPSKSFRPRFRGVETTFKVSNVIKGMPANDQIVLHHYRNETEWGSPPNGPDFISFTANDTNIYLLYLTNDGSNRYAPTVGQIDPGLSIRPLPFWTNFVRLGFPRFPVLAPVADANPAIRQPILARVPARLKIARTEDTFSVTIDSDSFESTNLLVGTNMITGVQSELLVYPVGEPRPTNRDRMAESGGLVFNMGTAYWHAKPDGIPQAGKRYIVEMNLAAFETDIPPQHLWSPQSSKNYKVIWQRILKQTVE